MNAEERAKRTAVRLHRRPRDGRNGRIEAISFDGDMTLWDLDPIVRHSLGHVLAELRRRHPCPASERLTISDLVALRNAAVEPLDRGGATLEERRLGSFQRAVEHVGSADPALAADLNAIYVKHRFERAELYDDVIPALALLGARYRLGLLSNGNGLPERCGLRERLAFVVFSDDAGARKPARAIFRLACQRAGCEPHALVHVGDSLEADVRGANDVGAVSVWLNRTGARNTSRVRPRFEISSLVELRAVVDALARRRSRGEAWTQRLTRR